MVESQEELDADEVEVLIAHYQSKINILIQTNQDELFRQVVEVFHKEHLKHGRPDYTELKKQFTITRKA